jgi:hypothetical protein
MKGQAEAQCFSGMFSGTSPPAPCLRGTTLGQRADPAAAPAHARARVALLPDLRSTRTR